MRVWIRDDRGGNLDGWLYPRMEKISFFDLAQH